MDNVCFGDDDEVFNEICTPPEELCRINIDEEKTKTPPQLREAAVLVFSFFSRTFLCCLMNQSDLCFTSSIYDSFELSLQ